MKQNAFSKITPEIIELSKLTQEASKIDPQVYTDFDVKRGLRDVNGKGVLVGVTNISEINSMKEVNGERIPIDGELFYRGINVQDIVKKQSMDNHFGFEEVSYLLLFGKLPNKQQLMDFRNILATYRTLPKNFVRDVMMKRSSKDMMNALSRSVLTLYSYDDNPDDTSPDNVLRQCLQLVAMFPLLSVYSYQAYKYYVKGESLVIHHPKKEYSTAENILHCLRDDMKFTPLEAKLLDVCLILHAEHGGGNNSTFTTHLVSSSGTDTYSAIAAALGSLKGPRHGGANIKVIHMFADMKKQVKDWTSEEEVSAYLRALLRKEAFDKAGLIYGMGHAIYTISDPRAEILKEYAKKLSEAEGYTKEFELYDRIENIAKELITKNRDVKKPVCANVDLYSGFVYSVLKIPVELFTPMFAIARIAGWSAHRIEELINNGKIIRPAYKYVGEHREYLAMEERDW